MTESERRLAAILSADVVGYSRLMAEDEDATVRTLTAYREQVGSLVQEHRGRLVDFSGDNFLSWFPSALEAVRCAVEIQRVLAGRNADLPPERKMEFRLGVHLGDIRVEGERIYGDGVNIAARLEGLAEAGGICISGSIRDQVRNKLGVLIEDLGEQTLKNIPEPVRVYRLRQEEPRKSTQTSPAPQAASEKPSIAVLPFANMSGDPEQEYFADGITEDLITGLSKISGLFVIARNSSFAYKGQSLDAKEIGRALAVKHLLEGSVRKAGDRVRITAQLIEAATGHHLWAERYDRKLEDIFALQDEVTEQIISALRVRITEGERAVLEHPPTENLEAYDCYLQGATYLHQASKEANERAREMFQRAIALDPTFAAAYAMLAMTYIMEWTSQWSHKRETAAMALEVAQRAVELDDSQSTAHAMLATSLTFNGRHDEAIAEGRKAVQLNQNDVIAYRGLANSLSFSGRPEESIPVIEMGMRLDPHDPFAPLFMGEALIFMRKIDEAIHWLKRAVAVAPDFIAPHVYLTVAYVERGEDQKAKDEVAEVLRITPRYSLEELKKRIPYKNLNMMKRIVDGLRKAGLS